MDVDTFSAPKNQALRNLAECSCRSGFILTSQDCRQDRMMNKMETDELMLVSQSLHSLPLCVVDDVVRVQVLRDT